MMPLPTDFRRVKESCWHKRSCSRRFLSRRALLRGANYWDHLEEMAEIAKRVTGKAPSMAKAKDSL